MSQTQMVVAITLLLALIHRAYQNPVESILDGSVSGLTTKNESNKTDDPLNNYNISKIPRSCDIDNGGCADLCVPERDGVDLHCRCSVGSKLHQDGRTCEGCHSVWTRSFGRITSPGYPEKYTAMLNCSWTIRPLKGHFLHITFANLDIKSSNCCLDDYLEIVRHGSHYSTELALHRPLRKRICGFYGSMSFNWLGEFRLNFRTVQNSFHTGFKMYYTNKSKRSPSITLSGLQHVEIENGPIDPLLNCPI